MTVHRAELPPSPPGPHPDGDERPGRTPGEDDSPIERLRLRRRAVLTPAASVACVAVVLMLAPIFAADPVVRPLCVGLVLASLVSVVLVRRRPRATTAAYGWAVLLMAALLATARGDAPGIGVAWLVDVAALGAVLFVPRRLGWIAPALATIGAAVSVAWAVPLATAAARPWLAALLAAAPVAAGAAFTLLFAHMSHEIEVELRSEVERRRDAQREALAAGLARDEVLARIVHDLRTPIHGIVGLADVLQRGAMTPTQRRQVGLIARQGQVFLTLVNDLLDLAQLSARKLEIRPRDFDPRALLQETSELVRVRAEAKGLELFVTVERGIPDRLHGDSARLRQILTNLADNAVKFTSEGRIDLTARLDRRDRDGTLWTRFEVRDTGPGIPEERRDRLFRPFEPSRDPRQDRMRGSGLGLAISAELARLMGGSLELAATTGPGARFQLTLPLHRGQRSRRDTTPVLGLPVLAQASPPRTGRLLVVEDDPVNREVLHSQLALLGLAADEVATGADALALFVPGRYEAALLDCDLPDLDGLELARRMREREGDGPLTPLIAVTASVLRSEPEPWRQSSFDDLLLKPFRVDELATILSAWLDTPIVAPPPAAGGGGSRLGGARRTAAAQDSHRPPEIDFESLESLAALPGTGGDDPAGRMVALFREHAGRDVAWLLAELARTAPSDELGQVAHRLKGSAASAGAVGLSRLAGEIETAAKSGEAEAARESAGALGPAFEAALESLANRLDELRAERGEP